MLGYSKSVWAPAQRRALGAREEGKILGIPYGLMWGGAGFVAGLGGAVVADFIFPQSPVPPTILGPLAVAAIGVILFWNAGKRKTAVSWGIAAAVPAAVQMAYGMLFPARAAA